MRTFLLSPAYCGGERARLLVRPEARFALAQRLRTEGAPIGEVFAFLSGLYFRGKLAYARAFARPGGALVITPNRGLVPVEATITDHDVRRFGEVDIAGDDPRYLEPLLRDARALDDAHEVVLLGSIATAKYVEPLHRVLGARLRVPPELAGRGDMSRGGLLLRHAHGGRELRYVPIDEAQRHGPRPPRLVRLTRAEIAAAARASCERLFATGDLEGIAFVDHTGAELVRLGDAPADVRALIAGQRAPKGVRAAFVGRRGVLLARGRRLAKRLDAEAAALSAILEGVA